MKKPMLYILIAFVTLQLLVPGYMIFRHYNTLVTGDEYKFIVVPYDPYDPFRGRFVQIRTEQSLRGTGDYALLDRDAQGYAVISGWSQVRPQGIPYAKNLVLNRYYMNEQMAPEAERVARELADTDQLYLSVKVKNGNYVIEGLYLNGAPIEQHIAG